MSENETLVKVENVSKKFCRSLKRSLWYGLSDMAAEVTGGSRKHDQLRAEEFWAVRDVSFELRRGECLGLIGRNGAGKTTLLKMLNGLIKPDHGRIEMRGNIGAVIALGAGFNPVLTGRENVFVNGSLMGLAKGDIDRKIDEILDFADIGEFIDAPVQSYSSGMQVRLGFAVATAMSPDVLLLDEVLAVGDAGFRHKCYSRISKLLKDSAVIFVSHSMEQVAQICHSILLMNKGTGTRYSDVLGGISNYNQDNQETPDREASVRAIYAPVQVADFTIETPTIQHGDSAGVCVRLLLDRPILTAQLSVMLTNEAGLPVVSWSTSQLDRQFDLPAGACEIRFPIGPLYLHPGKYNCSLFLSEPKSIEHYVWYWNQETLFMEGARTSGGIPVLAPYQGHSLTPISVDLLSTPRL